MTNKIVYMYQSGKGYKAISKALGFTVRALIHKWRKLVTAVILPRSGWPTKITPKAQWRLIQEVIKESRTSSKELQASFASIKVSVHDSTIRKRLGWEKKIDSPMHCDSLFNDSEIFRIVEERIEILSLGFSPRICVRARDAAGFIAQNLRCKTRAHCLTVCASTRCVLL